MTQNCVASVTYIHTNSLTLAEAVYFKNSVGISSDYFVTVLEGFRLEKVNGHRHSSGIPQEFRSRLLFPTKPRLFFIGEKIRENSE